MLKTFLIGRQIKHASSLPNELFSDKRANISAYTTCYSVGTHYMAQIKPKFLTRTELNTVTGAIITLMFTFKLHLKTASDNFNKPKGKWS